MNLYQCEGEKKIEYQQHELRIGDSVCAYQHTEHYTRIFDEEGDQIITLRWIAKEDEIKAALYGYWAGQKVGIRIGEHAKIFEIKKVLNIT